MVHHARRPLGREEELEVNPVFSRPGTSGRVPRTKLPAGELLPETAYQIVRDETMLDGNSRLNLATFVGTWMDGHAARLMIETADKNMIDKDEYPRTAEIESRCVAMLSHLWHAPESETAVGTSTIGSSEAAMFGGLAMKRLWQNRRKAAGKSTERPNLVMGINVQVCWDKFCNYFEVEPRLAPMDGERFGLNAEEALKLVDENTIGVVAILGSTFDGSYEPVAEICAALDDYQARTGIDIPVHVDGASGAFVAPFIDPGLVWDFQLERVASINASGHKYGLVYPGVGWIVFRDLAALPDELIFRVNYLGGEMPTLALNFSRPGSQVIAQYYNFLRLGFEGYRRVQQSSRDNAMYLSGKIGAMPELKLITDGSQLPVFAFTTAPAETRFSVFDLSAALRERGWLVPAYTFPANREDLAVLRIVVRNGFSRDMGDMLLEAMADSVKELSKQSEPKRGAEVAGFHH